jgi:hypothetical protein
MAKAAGEEGEEEKEGDAEERLEGEGVGRAKAALRVGQSVNVFCMYRVRAGKFSCRTSRVQCSKLNDFNSAFT